MDCLQAQQLLSLAIDSDVAEADLAEARAHCAGCAECERFLRSSERVASLPAPVAPPELVNRLIEIGAEEAAAIRANAQHLAEEPVAPAEPELPSSGIHFLPGWWAPRLTAYAAVAAVLLVALVATGVGLGGLLAKKETTATLSTDTRTELGGSTVGAAPSAENSQSAADKSAETSAPPYVVIDGLVYAPTGPRTVNASSLVTATPVTSALDTGGDALTLPAFTISGETGSAVLRMSDGTYIGFMEVTRAFGGKPFVLMSGSQIPAYGFWPTLPTRFQQPTVADGSPTFSFFGKDDSGTRIYVQPGGDPTIGFAVAPGTPPTDPAAGNPNWTWWQAR